MVKPILRGLFFRSNLHSSKSQLFQINLQVYKSGFCYTKKIKIGRLMIREENILSMKIGANDIDLIDAEKKCFKCSASIISISLALIFMLKTKIVFEVLIV